MFLTFGHHHGELFRTALQGNLCPALLKTAEEASDNERPGNNGKWLQCTITLLPAAWTSCCCVLGASNVVGTAARETAVPPRGGDPGALTSLGGGLREIGDDRRSGVQPGSFP